MGRLLFLTLLRLPRLDYSYKESWLSVAAKRYIKTPSMYLQRRIAMKASEGCREVLALLWVFSFYAEMPIDLLYSTHIK